MITSIDEAKKQMQGALGHLAGELKKIRTGRASASVLEGVKATVYGQPMPLNHIANVVAIDAQTLQITPFDPANLQAISAAIREDQSLGLNPADDGHVVRIPIPPMTEERRKEVVKQVGEKAEESKVSLRNIRHDFLKHTKQQEKDGDISKDESIRLDKQVTELIDDFQKQIDEAAKVKEQEVMKV